MHTSGVVVNTDTMLTDLASFMVANAGFSAAVPGPTLTNYITRRLTRGGIHLLIAESTTDPSFPLGVIRGMWVDGVALTAMAGVWPASDTGNTTATPASYIDLTAAANFRHFFTDGNRVAAAVRTSNGLWFHIFLGDVVKPSGLVWTGGEVFTGTFGSKASVLASNSIHHHYMFPESRANGGLNNINSGAVGNIRIGYSTYKAGRIGARSGTGNADIACMYSMTQNAISSVGSPLNNVNSYNSRSPGSPVHLYLIDSLLLSGATQLLYYLGSFPMIRFVNISLLNAEDVINGTLLNGWMVFPIVTKGPASAGANPTSGNFGVAYKLG